MRRPALALVALFAIAACEVGPDYVQPPVETPQAYKETGDWQKANPEDAIDRGAWWSVYKDVTLDQLEKDIDVSNQNLKAAEANYRAAQALVEETRASLFPSAGLNAGATRAGGGKKPATTTYTAGAQASWVPDVWGQIRREMENSEANAQVSAADLASARLSAQAALATDYFDLRMQDQLERLLAATVEDDTKALQIVQNQYKVGVAAQADVLAAQTQLETVQAQQINTGENRKQLEHAIAVLIGKPPAEFSLPPVKQDNRLPNVPAGVPSTLLQRRPDVASAERAMAAANAEIGVAVAAFYPAFTIQAPSAS